MQTDNTEFVMAITSRWEAAWYATISCCQTDGAQNEPSTDRKRLYAPGDGLSRAGIDEPGQPAGGSAGIRADKQRDHHSHDAE
jgi:hypothetical protein